MGPFKPAMICPVMYHTELQNTVKDNFIIK